MSSRPIWRLALLLLLMALVFTACGSRQSTGASQSWSGVAYQEGTESAFVGTHDGRIIQLVLRPNSSGAVQPSIGAQFNVKDRTEGQDKRSRVSAAFYGTPTVAEGRIYAGSYQGFVYSMLAADSPEGAVFGDVNAFEIEGDNLSKGIAGRVVYVNGLLVVAAAENIDSGRLYVLDAQALNDGAGSADVQHCRYPADPESSVGRIWATPLVLDGIAYFGDLDHFVHAVNIETCESVWDAPAELGGGIMASPVAIDGKLYLGTFDRKMYAIDMATGAAEELFEAESWFWATPAVAGSVVYAPNLDGILYAYDTVGRQLLWQYDQERAQETVLSDPVVSNNRVVMASDGGTITLVDSSGQRVTDIVIAEDQIRAPLTTNGDVVFVHTLDERVLGYMVEGDAIVKDWEIRLQGF